MADQLTIPLEVISLLKQMTESELETLANFKSSEIYPVLISITSKVVDSSASQVMNFTESDPTKLSMLHARCRGEYLGLQRLIWAIKGAEQEINKRAKPKKKR